MAKKNYETVGELIYYAYANLAMAHMAVAKKQSKYAVTNYMVRAKLFKGLKTGKMSMRTIFDDEKIKIQTGNICNYCGDNSFLALDHILPKKLGGMDVAENLIYACRSCNSSKGRKDLLEWMRSRDSFLPLLIIRRYLKLVYQYCETNELLDLKVEEIESSSIPFRIDLLPTSYPKPTELKEIA